MLETRELQSDIMYEQGYQTGVQSVQLEVLIRCVRCGLRGDEDESWRKILCEAIRPDQIEELMDFVRMYPRMPTKKLAEKVILESEYIYALYWYSDSTADSASDTTGS